LLINYKYFLMFDFEKLEVYKIARETNIKVLELLGTDKKVDLDIKNQWKRASMSMVLNLAEGTGRMSASDKKHFYTMSRGSVFECAAILDTLQGMNLIPDKQYQEIYAKYEQISKMLLGMFRSFNKET
jgi:four helix bundle protein